MCGIVALFATDDGPLTADPEALTKQLEESLERIVHRGPDGKGIWISEDSACALAHCRLSINDLSTAGAQPLHSPNNTIHAVVNGEIYSHDLRASLEEGGYAFKGHSDSELVIALYLQHGLSLLSYLRGEFALVLYDETTGIFIAARDRYGIKPLFWRMDGSNLQIAAEMKALLPLGWEPEWDVGAIVEGGWGQDTRTVFKGVSKLRPGHYMIGRQGSPPEIRQYWDLSYPDKTVPDARSEEDMVLEVRHLLLDAVRLRLRADVPVGIYLSGGIDSSALAGMAAHLVREEGAKMGSQDAGKEKVCCFSIGFDESSGFDESAVAERTASFLGVNYLRHHMSEATLAENYEEAVYHVEHHTHDLNFVGKYALSTIPRQHGYKVVLTGEGADEHFGGYPLYLPDFLREPDLSRPGEGLDISHDRKAVVEEQEKVVMESYEIIGARSDLFGPSRARTELNGTSTVASLLAFTPHLSRFSSWVQERYALTDPRDTIANNVSPLVKEQIREKWHPLHSALYYWTKGHLANQFLSCLGDRVEMAHSIEARTPFLDHQLAEYVNNLPPSLKIKWISTPGEKAREGLSVGSREGYFIEKHILREAVKPFVTEEVYGRRKHPYSAPTRYPKDGPVDRLLRGLLTKDRVNQLGFVDWQEMENRLDRAFSDEEAGREADVAAFRSALEVASWVVLSERFGVKTAKARPSKGDSKSS